MVIIAPPQLAELHEEPDGGGALPVGEFPIVELPPMPPPQAANSRRRPLLVTAANRRPRIGLIEESMGRPPEYRSSVFTTGLTV
jgi:hypothetical protein